MGTEHILGVPNIIFIELVDSCKEFDGKDPARNSIGLLRLFDTMRLIWHRQIIVEPSAREIKRVFNPSRCFFTERLGGIF